MSDRFSPRWRDVEPFLDALLTILQGSEHLLINEFRDVADPALKASSAAEVRQHLSAVVISPGIPWVLFDTVSAVTRKLPAPMQKAVSELEGIRNGFPDEHLRIAGDGRWLVGWPLDGSEWVNLDWYVPDERDEAPVVPVSVIDFVAGSVMLYRAGLILPAAANLLIALESVLWDRLTARGHPRTTEHVVYTEASWRYRVTGGDRLQIWVDGADRTLADFGSVIGSKEGALVLRKSHEEGGRAVLRVDVDPALVQYLATEGVTSRETVPAKGLAEAIQRARRLGILNEFPVQLDELLSRLRNGLIHLPYDGVLNPPVPNPAGGVISDLDDLRRESGFVGQVIGTVVRQINTLYGKG